MNITNIAHFDCAGICDKFKKGFDKYSKHTMRNIMFNNSILYYDNDVLIQDKTDFKKAWEVIEKTDIFIFHVVIKEAYMTFAPIIDWLYELKAINLLEYAKKNNKTVIFFLNGSSNLREFSEEYKDIFKLYGIENIMCSTPDLKKLFPEAFYSPVFLDLESDFYNIPIKKDEIVTLGHFPTDPKIKNTQDLITYYETKVPKIKMEIMQNLHNIHTLNVKRKIHLSFDHLQGYYGVNSLECAALGVINFVKMDSWNQKLFKEVAGTDIVPFELVDNMDDVDKKINYYLENLKEINTTSKFVRQWMYDHWHAKKHVNRMEKYFEEIK